MEEDEPVEISSPENRGCDSGCCSREKKAESPPVILEQGFELEPLPALAGVSDCCNKREDLVDCCDKSRCCPPRPANINVDTSLVVMDLEALKVIQQCCCLRGSVCCSDLGKSWCCDYILSWQSKGHRLSELRVSSPTSASVGSLTFDVEGMTCSSCESTLKNTLIQIQGVDLVSVSVVLGRAVVEGSVSAEEVVQIVYERTGFKLTLVSNQPTLFLRFPGECPRKFPPDVSISCHGHSVKFTYDPKRTTARDIFDFYASEGGNSPIVVEELEAQSHIWSTLGCRVLVSIVLAIPVLVLAYIPPRPVLYGAIQLSLVTGIMGYVISPLYKQSLHTLLRRREIEMDLLVVCSTLIAYTFSVISYIFTCIGNPISEPFWETPALLVTLIMLGRWITTRTRERAVQAVKRLSDTNVKTAVLENGRIVDVALLGYGDVITVQPGETIATDGVILKGETEVSEAMFTGESHAAKLKLCGDTVFAGSINVVSRVDIQVTKLASENALSGIRQLVDISQISKPRIQAYTDRVAGYLGPIALFVAIVAFIIWFFVDWRVRGNSVSAAAIQGLTYAIAVLAISCPCTIGLAVPMNVVIASGIAAARGILIKDTQALEVCHRVRAVVFDKTGTVTRGEPSVVAAVVFMQGAEEYVARLVAGAIHPVARAVAMYLGETEGFDCVKTIVGKGLEVKVDGGMLRGGNMRWLGVVDSGLTGVDGSVFCVTLNGQLIASYGLSDELRPESVDVVKALHAKKVDVYLVSGDNEVAANDIAKKLGISASKVQSNVLPGDKAHFVRDLQTRSQSPVIFCGDGINDAAALSQADIGISFVSASELTSSSATVLLLSNDLSSVLTLLTLSRRVYHRILVNFCWAGVYNLFAICLAAGVFVVWRIEPQWAGIGEFISVMPVVIVGWSLKWKSM